VASYAAVAGGGLVGLAAVSATGFATYFTRRVVTPLAVKPDDLEIYEVGPDRVVLSSTPDTRVPGRYGLWLDGGQGHARIGAVIADDAATVTRELEQVDFGVLTPGPARFNQYYVAGDPTLAWGVEHEDVLVPSEVGPLPTWLVRPEPDATDDGTWAVLIHGRGATREECLRGVPVLRRLGITTMVPAYRNDRDAPDGQVGRYHFGGTEWRDIESAVVWAVNNGARRVVLMGWSMGGAIALQLVSRSWVADRIDAVVLDAPVVDWGDVLRHTARVNHVPPPVGRISHRLVRHSLLRKAVGLGEPVDLRTLNWVRRARELAVPILLIHSEADEVVPVGPSRALAAARPELVTFAPWSTARHTKEWNVDPVMWENVVEAFLTRQLRG
jgi:alpha-beta hydrolase superfamily lysophospholipase